MDALGQTILTDSWRFSGVFAWVTVSKSRMMAWEFQSHVDGEPPVFLQSEPYRNTGPFADIIMAFDERAAAGVDAYARG